MRVRWKLTVASLKIFTRQKEAIIWTMLLPVFMVVLFGFISFEGLGKIQIGLVNQENSEITDLVEALKSVQTIDLKEGSEKFERDQLRIGERHLVLVIPSSFTFSNLDEVRILVNDSKPQETQLGILILRKIFDDRVFSEQSLVKRANLKIESVASHNQTYIDFFLPGVLSLAIMQSGIFGVAFGFVSLKKRGVLRRLSVTPIKPLDFVIAQVAMRLIVLVAQTIVLIGVGVLFFDLKFLGNLLDLFLFGVLGGIVFLAIGFVLAGIVKTEDQVAPLANVVSLPMMLLSGVFFNRSNLPDFVQRVTEFFPLTYLADAMRKIILEGSGFSDLHIQALGLSCWCLLSIWLAVRVFRWE